MSMCATGRHKRTFVLTALGIFLLAVVGCWLAWEFGASPDATFRRLVTSPIPRSIRNIKADYYKQSSVWARLRRGYMEDVTVLRFDINKKDLERIIAAGGFRQCRSFKWNQQDGQVDYTILRERHATRHDGSVAVTRGMETDLIALYTVIEETDRGPPDWFDLDKWTDGRAYLVGKDDHSGGWIDRSLLIYNDRIGSAYLIKDKASGWRGDMGGDITTGDAP